jgi:carbonic anhydrase/acetyltransferase-like protein (isoleucine patch superfamily)
MLIEHLGRRPTVHPTSTVAPTAVLCGDVQVGPDCSVAFGAVLTAEGAPVRLGEHVVVRENALLRSRGECPLEIGNHVLIGPHCSLNGCTVEDEVFLATGVTVFDRVRIGRRSEVRINGVVHVGSTLPPGTVVPIGWIAVGDPAQLFSPDRHDELWAVQRELQFPQIVYGVERDREGRTDMRQVTGQVIGAAARHRNDRVIDT